MLTIGNHLHNYVDYLSGVKGAVATLTHPLFLLPAAQQVAHSDHPKLNDPKVLSYNRHRLLVGKLAEGLEPTTC